MNLLFSSFWRALAGCFHPRVMLLSVLPLVVMAALSLTLGAMYWESALAWVQSTLQASTLMGTISGWVNGWGLGSLNAFLAPALVLLVVMPLVVVVSLLAVALLITPALTGMVAARRFPKLERRSAGGFFWGVLWALGSTVLALLALVISIPLWLIPPLVLVLPPLIWGWLTYRVMAFDALSAHASSQERREVFTRHRLSLLGMGIFCGYLGAAPSLVWASGVLFAAAFVVLVPLGIWLYTWVFAFSSLWFAHFCLAALEALRAEPLASPVPAASPTAAPAAEVAPLKAAEPPSSLVFHQEPHA